MEFELKASHVISFVLGMLFAFAVTFSCISSDKPTSVMRCLPEQTSCEMGITFISKKECERFAKEAQKVQPSVVRVCVESYQ